MKKLKICIIFLSIFLIITPIKTNAATTFGDLLDDLEELKEQKRKRDNEAQISREEYNKTVGEMREIERKVASLNQQIVDATKKIQELEKEIEEVTRRERINAINTCRELIQKFDLQPAEIGLKKLMRKGAMIPKFMGPKGETWTGRGRKPIWLQQAELEGKSLEDFRITSPVAMEEDEDARLEELTRPDNVKA